MGPEGELRVELQRKAGRVAGLRVHSSRPDVARRLLQGRRRTEVIEAVPRLFSVCGRAQAAACALACTAAAGEAPDARALARAGAAVTAESLRESAWRLLLEWPRRLGEAPDAVAVAAARAVQDGPPRESAAQALAVAVFGRGSREWLALESAEAIGHWIDGAGTAAARFLRQVRESSARQEAWPQAGATPALPAKGHAQWVPGLAAACDAEADFARHPHWQGAPAETGAPARLHDDPCLRALQAQGASPVLRRLVARLREFARMLEGGAEAAVGATALPAGGAVAWVETSRGLLLHRVRLEGEVVRGLCIVAPTEWNFHPQGVLARELVGLSALDADQIKARAESLVHALDPCVTCRVGLSDA